jgi:hypothetical protein
MEHFLGSLTELLQRTLEAISRRETIEITEGFVWPLLALLLFLFVAGDLKRILKSLVKRIRAGAALEIGQ